MIIYFIQCVNTEQLANPRSQHTCKKTLGIFSIEMGSLLFLMLYFHIFSSVHNA